MNLATRLSAAFPRFWADLKSPDFAKFDMARVIAVLPLAAIEQHGPHLPLDVDRALVDGVIASAFAHLPADLPVFFLPTQSVGFSPEHTRFAGTLTLKAGTIISLWTELAESVAASGVKKLVLFNSHGGQAGLLDIVARDLRARLGMLVYSVNSFNLRLGSGQDESVASVDKLFSAHEHRFGIHAGDIETSMMLALKPEQVDMAKAQDFTRHRRIGRKNSAFWATAEAPSWPGKFRTTTRTEQREMPLRQLPARVVRYWAQWDAAWRTC